MRCTTRKARSSLSIRSASATRRRSATKTSFRLFTAEKFDADAWADLFARRGAKFAGPVAVHHDNFAMWDSQVTPLQRGEDGPEPRHHGRAGKGHPAAGLKFITTFHHGFAWRYYEPSFAFDGADPATPSSTPRPTSRATARRQAYLDQWLAMVNEVVGKYQPDMIWFDFELVKVIPPEYQRKMFADYYNWAADHRTDSAVAHKFREIHKYTGILDFERGREDRLAPYPWLTDTAMAEWFNQKSAPYRSVDNLVDVLIDIVSKNGCMLLDVSPAADGTIPAKARETLLGIGDWLKINGEAIYGRGRGWSTARGRPARREADSASTTTCLSLRRTFVSPPRPAHCTRSPSPGPPTASCWSARWPPTPELSPP